MGTSMEENKHGGLKNMSFGSDVEGVTFLCFFDHGSWFQVKLLLVFCVVVRIRLEENWERLPHTLY